MANDLIEQTQAGELPLGRAEERTLTIYFSDIAGFTTISEALKPEELVQVLNEYLTRVGGLDTHTAPVVGFAVDSGCTYKKSFAFPEPVQAGLCVTKLGNSSVRYEVGLFGEGDDEPRATGFFVHVFVDRAAGKSMAIPERIRYALQAIFVVD